MMNILKNFKSKQSVFDTFQQRLFTTLGQSERLSVEVLYSKAFALGRYSARPFDGHWHYHIKFIINYSISPSLIA